MTDARRAIAAELLRIGAVLIRPDEPFTWASGIESPVYTDNRLTLGYPELRRSLSHAFADLLRAHAIWPDVIAGTATAGIPHAAWLADRLDLPMVYVRSKPKAHGRGNQIEGPLAEGQQVVLVEDLVSTGGSSLEAVEALRAAGASVAAVVAVFSYNLARARQAFADADVRLLTVTDFDALVAEARTRGTIGETQAADVLRWRDTLQ